MPSIDVRQPAEWTPHAAVWTAFPSHGDLWLDALEPARSEFCAMCRAIADPDPQTGEPRGEKLKVFAFGDEAVLSARESLEGLAAEVIPGRFGDIWFRDTAPIFTINSSGHLTASCFLFNGWGGKYILPFDNDVPAQVVERSGIEPRWFNWILEGGSVEADGNGTLLTTRQCLLNPNRNPGVTEQQMEERLREALGAEKILWLDDGLVADHTDGHIDNLARFIAPGVVACPSASGTDDPNADTFEEVAARLGKMKDAIGQKLEVVRIPSPGRVLNEDGDVVPASHMNFYISNTRVIVPIYGTRYDEAALAAVEKYFPTREVVGIRANSILLGGGSFHCITQNQPSV